MARSLGRSKASAPPSFADLLKSDAQRQLWLAFDHWLWRELVALEPEWDDAVWERFQRAADANFPKGLAGALARAKRLAREQPKVAGGMLVQGILAESCASVYVARAAGALDLTVPLLAFAAIPAKQDPSHPGDVAMLRYLASAGADPNLRVDQGLTALHLVALREARPWGHPRAIRLLLGAGADPNVRSAEGETPLLLLCSFVQFADSVAEGIRALRAAGASMETPASDGDTPLSLLAAVPAEGLPVSEESEKNRRELLAEFQRDGYDDTLPQGAPSSRVDIDGRRR